MTPYAQYKAWWMRWGATGWDDKDKAWEEHINAWEEHINELTLFELMETLELYERKDT